VAVIGLIAVGLAIGVRGAPRRADRLESAFLDLLRCEVDQAILFVRPRLSRVKFLQFPRYKKDDGSLGIKLAFPYAAWSVDYFPQVVTEASKRGLSYEVDGTGNVVDRFVFVRFDESVDQAADFAKFILLDVFGFDANYSFRIRIN